MIGIGLWIIGVPSPALWGLLAAVLRFVPYVGAIVAALLPLIFAVAVDPGWTIVLSTALLFLIVEPLVGHILEPLLYGRSTGLSPVAVVAAATFWTWLWDRSASFSPLRSLRSASWCSGGMWTSSTFWM